MRLSARHQGWIYCALGVLFLTGCIWLVFHYWIKVEGEFGIGMHPLEPWWMKLHGAAAMLFLFLLGTLLPSHMDSAWRKGRNIASGIFFATFNALLILTGYALYYFGGENTRPVISALHWGVGLAAPFIIGLHVWRGRATRPGAARRHLRWRRPRVAAKHNVS
jgi:hypothetical protein